MNIFHKHAGDDRIAHHVAQGIEDAGAKVFSISQTGHFYTVWAKYEYPVTPETIDDAINKVRSEYAKANT